MKTGACREEQAVYLHKDPGSSDASELQGEQGEEPGGYPGREPGYPDPGVSQRHVDLAGPAASYEE